MTRLQRRVARATLGKYNVLYPGPERARAIVVELVPGDAIEFRELRGRHRWRMNIAHAFRLAVLHGEFRGQKVMPLVE